MTLTMWLTGAVTVSVPIQGCWQCCFRTVVRPSIWDKSSDIKIGQWGQPWLIWYVPCKRRCAPRFTKLKHRHRHRVTVMIVAMKLTQSGLSQPHDAMFTASDELWLESPIKSLLKVLLQSLASIPQIYQSIFQINRADIASHSAKPPPKRKTVYSEPCHVLRGEKCRDASRMFALKYRVRRDLNTALLDRWRQCDWLTSPTPTRTTPGISL